MTALVIIDIDGVVKPFTSSEILRELPGYEYFEGATKLKRFFILCIRKQAWLSFIEAIKEACGGDVKFVWGSAWGEDSNTVLEVLGLEERWEHIELSREDVGLGTWKLKSILPVIESEPWSKVVWLDDELEADVQAIAKEHGAMLAIAPERYEALTDEAMASVVDFLAS